MKHSAWITGLWITAAYLVNVNGLGAAESEHTTEPAERAFLPDLSQGMTGRIGPFWWGRSLDMGEELRFTDSKAWPTHDGTYLWSHQFNRVVPKQHRDDHRGVNHLPLHARNNLVSIEPNLAWQVQMETLWLNAPSNHNAKITLGYVPQDFRFQHGDNTDLEHLADAPRVVLFIPVRHELGTDGHDLAAPYVSPHYAAQSVSVLEFAPQETIQYAWFANPQNLHPRILCDLVPFLNDERLHPGITKPLFRFDLTGEPGGWRVRIERDGRDGLAGGSNPDGWDIDITSGQDGARPYTVDLDPHQAAWSLSLFSPGGRPAGTSQFLLGLQPYQRGDDSNATWPDRQIRQRSLPAEQTR
jgi:hypothetical protein